MDSEECEWVVNKAGVGLRKELLKTVIKQRSEHAVATPGGNKGVAWRRDNARNNARCTHASEDDHAQLDGHIKTWTRLTIEESVMMAEDRDKWRKYVHGVANPPIEDG